MSNNPQKHYYQNNGNRMPPPVAPSGQQGQPVPSYHPRQQSQGNRNMAYTNNTRQPRNGYTQPPPTSGAGKPPRKQKGRPGIKVALILMLVALLAGGIYFGVQKLRENQVKAEIAPYENVYGANIFINDISIAGMTPEQARQTISSAMQQRVNSWNLAIQFEGWTYYNMTYPVLGIDYSDEQLYPYLNEAWALTHPNNADVYQKKQAIEDRKNSPYEMYTTKKEFDQNNLDQILNQIAAAIYREPMDAVLLQFRPDDSNPFLIRDEQVGRALDVEATKATILEMAAAGTSGNYEVVPIYTTPKITRKDVEKTVALRAEAVTAISKDSPENRTNNIRVSLARINGTILEPGEKFSFNDVVGPRTFKDGFFEAFEMVKGDLVTGVGGGVCQSSTTLYQAALMSDLQIVDRDIHSSPVLYTEKGQDATVFLSRDREIDFVFKNTTPGRLYLTAQVTSGSSSKNLVTKIRIYGETLGDNVVYRLHSVIDEVLKSEEIIYVPDKEQEATIYKDETKLRRKAVDGYSVSTYLRKYMDGILVDEKLVSRDKYNAKPAEYWQGTTVR